MKNKFNKLNPDYPINVSDLDIEYNLVSDSDIPSGNGGINGEGYSYGELRRTPVIPELMSKISIERIREYASECNARNQEQGFEMFKVNGEYCFWNLRVGPAVKVPTVDEIRAILLENPATAVAVNEKCVTAKMIRDITYDIIRKKIAEDCEIELYQAAQVIGNMLDCAPHEDICGQIFMVPNWAHRWFRHDGYVSEILATI